MKKVLLIGGVIVILAVIGLGLLGFKSEQLENIEARETPKGTVEKVIEFYKNDDELDKKLMFKFHSKDFERLVTERQLLSYWANTLSVDKASNLSVQTISQRNGKATVEVTIRDQAGKKFKVYLNQIQGIENRLIWEIQAYQFEQESLGNIP